MGALSDVLLSRYKVMFDALSLKEHKGCASTSLFSDRDHGMLKLVIQPCTWERKMLPKLAPRSGSKPHNHVPRKRSHAQQLLAPLQLRHQRQVSSNATTTETGTFQLCAIGTSLLAAKHGG